MPPKKEDYDDAALARALQEEYEREYRRRGMEQHLRRDEDWAAAPYPTAPTAEEVFDMDRTSFYSNHNNTGFFDEVEIGDEGEYKTSREQERVLAEIKRQQKKTKKSHSYGSSAGLESGPPISGTKTSWILWPKNLTPLRRIRSGHEKEYSFDRSHHWL